MHPIQETGRRPTAALDRNLAYLGLVEVLHGYPLDGVVLTTGCDKTTPACLMAAATVDMPAIVLSGGPMLNGWHDGQRTGSGTIVWKARELLAAGEIDEAGFVELVASSAPSPGHCNTMGTASTMNSLAEALGMSLPGSRRDPGAAPRPGRATPTSPAAASWRWCTRTSRPPAVLTREAFENAIVVNSAIGGSTNAPVHLGRDRPARRRGPAARPTGSGSACTSRCSSTCSRPGSTSARSTTAPAGCRPWSHELMAHGLVHEDALTVNGRTLGENCRDTPARDRT